MMNRFTISDLTNLQGPICYLDASMTPDNTQTSQQAGIGIFIANLQEPMYQSI
jgi:hypothetical protein